MHNPQQWRIFYSALAGLVKSIVNHYYSNSITVIKKFCGIEPATYHTAHRRLPRHQESACI